MKFSFNQMNANFCHVREWIEAWSKDFDQHDCT